jgi:hypothetical protein
MGPLLCRQVQGGQHVAAQLTCPPGWCRQVADVYPVLPIPHMYLWSAVYERASQLHGLEPVSDAHSLV